MNAPQSDARPTLLLGQDESLFTRTKRAIRRSVRTVVYLLRTVAAGILWTAMSLFTGSAGNFFTGKSVADQSEAEFISTTILWNQLMFCGFSIATQSAFLTKQRFVDQPNRPAGYLMCVVRVFKATIVVAIVTSAFPIGVVYAMSAVASPSSCVLRWSFYFCSIAACLFTTFLTIAVRRIFLQQTIAGTERKHKQLVESGAAIPRHDARQKDRFKHFLRVMFQVSPGTLSSAFAAVYVQASSTNLPTSQRDLAIFAFCSIILKLIVQELVKIAIMRRKVRDIRTMFLVVAVPTVLIDTQVRVMLQLANNVNTTVGGSILMAFIEIGMRSGKMFYLRAEVCRKLRRVHAPVLEAPARRSSSIFTICPKTASSRPKSESREQRKQKFDLWKMQLLRFQAAEAYADMAAEYMALASSAMIVAVYAYHPKYELSQWHFGVSTSTSTDSSRYIILLGFQLVIELVVDMVSCVVEILYGVNFDELKKYQSFVTALFVVIGVMNVQITAIMYLKCK